MWFTYTDIWFTYTDIWFTCKDIWFMHTDVGFTYTDIWFIYTAIWFTCKDIWFMHTDKRFIYTDIWFTYTDIQLILSYTTYVAPKLSNISFWMRNQKKGREAQHNEYISILCLMSFIYLHFTANIPISVLIMGYHSQI